MSDLVVLVRVWLVRIGFAIGRLRPMRRAVLLATAHADRIGGNLAFVGDELARTSPEIPVTVLAHRARGGWRGRLSGALAGFRAGAALARHRLVVVDDYFFPIYAAPRRPGSTIVQTWHASGAFKTFGHSVGDRSFGADAALTRRVRIHANYDVCLVGSSASVPAFAEAFGLPAEHFRTDIGIPRTDLLVGADAPRVTAEVRQRYGLHDGRTVVLYAPTFRGDRVTHARSPADLDLGLIAAELGGTHRLLLRLHPFVAARQPVDPSLDRFVVDVSDHPDINALMLAADLLVTDYSSAIFEFSLLERPMAFFAPDLDAYERERGFYVDYRSWVPGPVFETTEPLVQWLRDGPYDLDRVRAFRQQAFEVADGHASERFVREIVLPALR